MPFLVNAAKYYKAEPHQKAAWEALEAQLPKSLISEFKDSYRGAKASPMSFDNSWDGIYACAKKAGAKYPECVAAQWALESAFGTAISGKNNFFGIKGKGTVTSTWEDYGYGPVTIDAEFKDFATPFDCVNHLVTRWYRDYKGYKGVNRASSREECARLLKAEGYATDPVYANKLINLMKTHD